MEAPPSSNASYIPAAAMDLLLAFPRFAQRAGSFALFHMPEAVDNIAAKIMGSGGVIADATAHQVNSTMANTSRAFVQSTATAFFDDNFKVALREGASDASTSVIAMVAQFISRLKNFGGIFSYLTSKWALATFMAAILLNRTQFYASSRQHLRLRWHVRVAIYAIPIAGFLMQLVAVLQALRCQTSPDFPLLRYGDPTRDLTIDFGAEGGLLYRLSSTLLFWQDDSSACVSRNMSKVALGDDQSELRGSMSLLFYFFLTLCSSQVFENLACALQGKQPMPEFGMTLFEHSLAFAECEAMISSAVGFGLFGSNDKTGPSKDGILLTRSEVLQRLNVPPEVLLVCLISCFSHLSSAMLAITGIRHKVRLFNTALWAMCYMSAFIWSFAKVFTEPVDSIADLGLLRFPTVCIVGFIPHLLILVGIVTCSSIYAVAMVLTALSVPEDIANGMSIRQRFAWAYQNLQANVQFSNNSQLRLKLSDDFYTTLLRLGFSILSAASEAVYLNEGSRIHVPMKTWVEQKRIDDLAAGIDRRRALLIPPELLGEGIARGVQFSDHQHAAIGYSPYARERRSKPPDAARDGPHPGELDTGLGLVQRRNRMHLTFDFVAGLFWLVAGLAAHLALRVLRQVGVARRPAWLLKAAGVPLPRRPEPPRDVGAEPQHRDFWLLGPNGRRTRPKDDNVDVEAEARRMWYAYDQPIDEATLSSKLYHWWQAGGWFGDLDDSGDFMTESEDDDTTSVISMSTNASTVEYQSEGEESGQRTPTQGDFLEERNWEVTPEPDNGLDVGLLSRLLNPQTNHDREEAKLLSFSLQSSRATTRSQYRRDQERARSQLLAGLRSPVGGQKSEEEEERDMEHFILDQRSKAKLKGATGGSWESGAEGMGAEGPQCVVCQSAPRTILVWPCGCLSMCDDCRVGLAARNHTRCICCRTEVAAYSRLYVP